MIALYEPAPQNDCTTVRDMLIEIRDLYKLDIIKLIYFSQNSKYPYVKISCKKVRRANQIEYNYMLNIEDMERSFFSLVGEEKKAIFYNFNKTEIYQKYCPLNKYAKTEIYYPLLDFENQEVVGCIYLGSIKKIKVDPEKIIGDYRFAILNRFILVSHRKIKKSNHILTLLKLFDDFLIKNNSRMLTHHYNVAYLANKIADEINMASQDKVSLYYASLLHDIGEIYINGNILNKKEKLTGEEYQIIKNHVVYGANLVKQILNDRKKEIIVKIIMEHHERYDGSGYPRGLKGEEIDLKSRIISVADAVDSMLTGRNYKARMSTDEVINELKANKGTQFDPTIADVMIKILYERTVVKSMVEKIPIIIATLSVFTKDNCFLIPGTLIKKEAFYEFHPNYISDLDLVKWPEVSQLTLSYVANQDIFEYQAKLLEVKDSIVYLSNLENKSTMISYSLLWELRGVLYIDETTAIPIKTARMMCTPRVRPKI